jgi:hypothetical protein
MRCVHARRWGLWLLNFDDFGNVLVRGGIAVCGKVLRFGWWRAWHVGFGRALRCKLMRIGQPGTQADWPVSGAVHHLIYGRPSA